MKGQPVSVSEYKLSDLVQEVKRARRERLDSGDSPLPRIPPVQRKSQAFRWTDSISLVQLTVQSTLG